MAENKPISVYGIPELTSEEKAEQQEEYYKYLQALINAEKLNPDDDWEGVRATKLLRKIASSFLTEVQRKDLMALLDDGDDVSDLYDDEEE